MHEALPAISTLAITLVPTNVDLGSAAIIIAIIAATTTKDVVARIMKTIERIHR